MKVAFFTYPSAFQNIGGGEILLLKLKEYLEREGVEVDLFDIWRSRVEQFDILHVFGSVKDCLGLVHVARARNIRVVITPLLWSDLRRALFCESWKQKIDLALRHSAKWLLPSFPSPRRTLLTLSDLIFPNSEIEKKQIARFFSIPDKQFRVIYNGVDKDFCNADPSLFVVRYGKEPFILSVGRIEPRKNQLNLIKAVKKIDGRRLVLIGSPVSGYESYFAECQKEGAGFTQFVPTLNHHDPLLKSAYAACDLFVLQGWFETPGLVAMEAALAGARLVVTQGGSTREYFKDMAFYMNPASPSDIQKKIVAALKHPKDARLRRHILDHYTWDRIAQATVDAYRSVLRP